MKQKNHQPKLKNSKVATLDRQDVWPCPKNNQMITWRKCWLVNRILPGRFYGRYDCWQCLNLINLQREAHKHKTEVLIGLIAALVILLCLAGIIIYVWLTRRMAL